MRRTLRIGGLVKLSALDFPGILSAVVFTQGCNFHCPYCHNPELVRPFGLLKDEPGVLAFLKTRIKLLDGVVISGGEPTIIEDLAEFILKLKGMSYRVKLDTNGSRPEVVEDLVDRHLVDYVALDVKGNPAGYPPELAPQALSEKVIQTVNFLKNSSIPHEFRTTVVRPFVSEKIMELIASRLAGPAPLHLQAPRLDNVYDPAFMARHPDQPGPSDLKRLQAIASRYLPCFIR